MFRLRKTLSLAAIGLLRFPHYLVAAALRRNRRRMAAPGVSYAEVREQAVRLAGFWASQGLKPGDRVLIDLPNSLEFLVARLAAVLGGFVGVPIPPGTSDRRLGWIAEFSEARAYAGFRPGAVPGLPALEAHPGERGTDHWDYVLRNAPPLERLPRLGPDHPLLINFTSGTTGEPKGVVSTVCGWVSSLYHALRENPVPVGRDEVFLHAVPMATAGSTLILPAVLAGVRNLFLPSWDPERAVDLVEQERVTRIFLTPTMLGEFVDACRARRADVSSLRAVIYGTEGIPVSRITKALDTLGPVLQQGYGMAEALPPVCLLHPHEHRRAWERGDTEVLGSAGRPTRAVDLRITDAAGKTLPACTPGKILIRGPTVSPGYWKRPDLTRSSRVDGYYVTGDIGFLDPKGYLHVLGREGRTPPSRVSELVEWTESRPDVCMAWAREAGGRILLHVVPARGRRLDPTALREDAHTRSAAPVEVRVVPRAPMTPAYKLKG